MSTENTNIEEPEFVGLNFLRKRFGVTHRQIHAWAVRRSGGFPEPVAYTVDPAYPGDKVGTPQFDLEAVDAWHETYRPEAGRGAHWAKKRAAKVDKFVETGDLSDLFSEAVDPTA